MRTLPQADKIKADIETSPSHLCWKKSLYVTRREDISRMHCNMVPNPQLMHQVLLASDLKHSGQGVQGQPPRRAARRRSPPVPACPHRRYAHDSTSSTSRNTYLPFEISPSKFMEPVRPTDAHFRVKRTKSEYVNKSLISTQLDTHARTICLVTYQPCIREIETSKNSWLGRAGRQIDRFGQMARRDGTAR